MPETVTLHSRSHTGQNVHGDPTGAATDDVDVDGVEVAPNRGPGTEENVGQATVVSSMALYLPPGSPVPASGDAMTVRGDDSWEVTGQPGVWPEGIEVFLRRAR